MISPPVLSPGSNQGTPLPALVAPVSLRSPWAQCVSVSGTVNGYTAATTSSFPHQVLIADQVLGANGTTGNAIVAVPIQCTYMEVGIWGDGSSISTTPVLKFYRTSGVPAGGVAGSQYPLGGEDNWSPLFNLNGSNTPSFAGSVTDVMGAAAANRYGIFESNYQDFLFDVRGSRLVAINVNTLGTSGNFALYVRFY